MREPPVYLTLAPGHPLLQVPLSGGGRSPLTPRSHNEKQDWRDPRPTPHVEFQSKMTFYGQVTDFPEDSDL